MKKIGLIFDSTCGYTKKELNERGIGFFPLMIKLGGKDYRSNDEITAAEIFEKLSKNPTIDAKTSSPIPKDIIEAYDYILENYEEAIYIGMSHVVSSTISLAKKIANSDEKYKGKIHVLDSLYMAPWNRILVDDLVELVEKYSVKEIIGLLEQHQKTIVGWISPGDIVHFYNGGRITKTQYRAAKLLRIRPVLTIFDGKISEKEILNTRSVEGALKKVISKDKWYLDRVHSLGFTDITINDLYIIGVNSGNIEIANKIEELIGKIHPNIKKDKILTLELGAEQAVHLGPNSFAFAFYVPLKYFVNKLK